MPDQNKLRRFIEDAEKLITSTEQKKPKKKESELQLVTSKGDTIRAKNYVNMLKESASYKVLTGQGTRADSALAGFPRHVLSAEKTKSPTAQYQELLYPARVTAGGDTLRAKTYSGLLKEKASFNVLRGQGTRADSALAGYPVDTLSPVGETPIAERQIKALEDYLKTAEQYDVDSESDRQRAEREVNKIQQKLRELKKQRLESIKNLQEKKTKSAIIKSYGGKEKLVTMIDERIKEMKKAGVSGPEIRYFIDGELKKIGLTWEDLR